MAWRRLEHVMGSLVWHSTYFVRCFDVCPTVAERAGVHSCGRRWLAPCFSDDVETACPVGPDSDLELVRVFEPCGYARRG